jgi:hypothetical protein
MVGLVLVSLVTFSVLKWPIWFKPKWRECEEKLLEEVDVYQIFHSMEKVVREMLEYVPKRQSSEFWINVLINLKIFSRFSKMMINRFTIAHS